MFIYYSPGMSKTERLASLSPAARRLASTRGITIGTGQYYHSVMEFSARSLVFVGIH